MKHLVWALSFVMLAGASSAFGETIQSYAKIIKATSNMMFPVATVKLIVEQPCSSNWVGPVQNKVGDVVQVGVLLESELGVNAACLSMPTEEEAVIEIDSMTPFTLELINAKDGVVVEIGN